MGLMIDPATGEVTEPEPDEPETENPDAEPDDEPLGEPDEPDDEPEAHDPSSLTVIAERTKKIEQETRRHENALRKVYGDDFETLNPCPLCLADGWLAPVPAGFMEPEQWDAIKAAAGQFDTAEYQEAPYAERCATCDGWGQVLSGSRNEAGALIVCRDCNGNGWREKIGAPAGGIPRVSAMHPVVANGTSTDESILRDQWNRPAGHRHFGIPPDQLD